MSTRSLDERFFEEYKRLDRLCADLLSGRNGVSQYIREMESRRRKGAAQVPGWDADYKSLKHVRWVRNTLAHEPDARGVSREVDLRFVREFSARLRAGQDPLSTLEAAKKGRRLWLPALVILAAAGALCVLYFAGFLPI